MRREASRHEVLRGALRHAPGRGETKKRVASITADESAEGADTTAPSSTTLCTASRRRTGRTDGTRRSVLRPPSNPARGGAGNGAAEGADANATATSRRRRRHRHDARGNPRRGCLHDRRRERRPGNGRRERQGSRATQSSATQPSTLLSDTNLRAEMDAGAQEIIDAVMRAGADGATGGAYEFGEGLPALRCRRQPSLQDPRRLKRSFLKIVANGSRGPTPRATR